MATESKGVDELWDTIVRHREFITDSGELACRRAFRLREELREIVARRLEQKAREIATGDRWDDLQQQVLDRNLDPWGAADAMLDGIGA
ncbi:MAG: hypothetical protein R2713_08675 [Ilumatobacteraceae bacterium]